MTQITFPVSSSDLNNSESCSVTWICDELNIAYFNLFFSKDEIAWYLIAEKISSAGRSYSWDVSSFVGQTVYIKLEVYKRKPVTTFLLTDYGLSGIDGKIRTYDPDSELLYDVIKVGKLKQANFLENRHYLFVDQKARTVNEVGLSGVSFWQHTLPKVLEGELGAHEDPLIYYQDPFIPDSATQNFSGNYLITEHSPDRFYSAVTKSDGSYESPQVFKPGFVSVSLGKKIGAINDSSLILQEFNEKGYEFDEYSNVPDTSSVYKQTDLPYEFSGIALEVSGLSADIDVENVSFYLSGNDIDILTHSIYGVVYNSETGAGVPGVSIKSGTITAADGTYLIDGLFNTTLDLTPSKTGYVFEPTHSGVTISTDTSYLTQRIDFVGTPVYSISGRLKDQRDVNLSQPVDLTFYSDVLGGSEESSVTGTFSLPGLKKGTYVLVPYRTSTPFVPSYQTVVLDDESISGINFSTQTYGIAGHAYQEGTLKSGVSVTYTEDDAAFSDITDGTGSYLVQGLLVGTYEGSADMVEIDWEAAAESLNLSSIVRKVWFQPRILTVNITSLDVRGVSNQDFVVEKTYSISGSFIDLSGLPLTDREYTLLGTNKDMKVPDLKIAVNDDAVQADIGYGLVGAGFAGSDGKYGIGNLLPGEYIVYPTKSISVESIDPRTGLPEWDSDTPPAEHNFGYKFSPSKQDVYLYNANAMNQNFIGCQGDISGTVREAITLSGLPGMTLEVVGGEYHYSEEETETSVIYWKIPKTVTTNVNGLFKLNDQIPGSYEIYPGRQTGGKRFYTVSPTSKVCSLLEEQDVLNQDFIATLLPQRAFSGTIRDEVGVGLSGIWIFVTDGQQSNWKTGKQSAALPSYLWSGISNGLGNFSINDIDLPTAFTISIEASDILGLDCTYKQVLDQRYTVDLTSSDVVGYSLVVKKVAYYTYYTEEEPEEPVFYVEGYVKNLNGLGVSGISMLPYSRRDTGAQFLVSTDVNGKYLISGLTVDTYQVGPEILSKSSLDQDLYPYYFHPALLSGITIKDKTTSGINFTAMRKFKVKGEVEVDGTGLGGVYVLFNTGHSKIEEITPAKSSLWTFEGENVYRPNYAEEKDNKILVANSYGQSVFEIDKNTKTVLWKYGFDGGGNGSVGYPGNSVGFLRFPMNIRFLSSTNNYLIADWKNRRSLILNTDEVWPYTIVWSYTVSENLTSSDSDVQEYVYSALYTFLETYRYLLEQGNFIKLRAVNRLGETLWSHIFSGMWDLKGLDISIINEYKKDLETTSDSFKVHKVFITLQNNWSVVLKDSNFLLEKVYE